MSVQRVTAVNISRCTLMSDYSSQKSEIIAYVICCLPIRLIHIHFRLLALKVRHWVVSRFTLQHKDRISETSAIKFALCYYQVKVTFTLEEAMMAQKGN